MEYPPGNIFEDDFPSPKVGYASFLESIYLQMAQNYGKCGSICHLYMEHLGCVCVVCFEVTLQKKAQLIFLGVGKKATTTMIVWLGKRNLD